MRLLAFSLLLSLGALAQAPPRILQIYQDQLKLGAVARYEQIEAGASQSCRDRKCPNPYLAIRSVSGLGEVWFLNGYDSFATMERVWEQYSQNAPLTADLNRVAEMKADLVFQPRTILARYREGLSRESGTPFSRMRYVAIETVGVRPGAIDDYEQARLIAKAAHEMAKSPEGHLVYQAVSGTLDGAFFILTPMRSVQELETVRGHNRQRDAKLLELLRNSVVSSETALFAVSAPMSYPAQEWVGADPGFWSGKPHADAPQ